MAECYVKNCKGGAAERCDCGNFFCPEHGDINKIVCESCRKKQDEDEFFEE